MDPARRDTRGRIFAALQLADQRIIDQVNARASTTAPGSSSALTLPQHNDNSTSTTIIFTLRDMVRESHDEIDSLQRKLSNLKKRSRDTNRKKNAEIRKLRKELATRDSVIGPTQKKLENAGKEGNGSKPQPKRQQKLKGETESMQQRQHQDQGTIRRLRKSLKNAKEMVKRLEHEKKTGAEEAAKEKSRLEGINASLQEKIDGLTSRGKELETAMQKVANIWKASESVFSQVLSPITGAQRMVAVVGPSVRKPETQNNVEEGQGYEETELSYDIDTYGRLNFGVRVPSSSNSDSDEDPGIAAVNIITAETAARAATAIQRPLMIN